jgi:hypothetical protein
MLELLYEALNSPLGIIVETNDVQRLRAKLYPLRAADPALACLSFVESRTHPNQLYLVRKPDEVAAAETYTPSA